VIRRVFDFDGRASGGPMDMEHFISQAQIVLPVLGLSLLRGQTEPVIPGLASQPSAGQSPVFEMSIPGGVAGSAQLGW